MRCSCLVLFIIALFLFNAATNAQSSVTVREPSFLSAKNYFQSEVKEDAHLYVGKEYYKYESGILGFPFFTTELMQTGDIFYNGMLYKSVPMLYDIARQVVVINKYQQETRMQLLTEKINYFVLNGHRFETISDESDEDNMSKGFFDVAFKGKVSVLIKRIKTIQKALRAEDPYSFKEEDEIYVKKGKDIINITNKKAALQLFDDKKDLVKTFARKNNLKFKKDIEKDLITTAAYYSTLN